MTVPSGAIANQFQAFEDRPLQWDAWDVDIFFEDKMWKSDPAISVNVIESGPLRATRNALPETREFYEKMLPSLWTPPFAVGSAG